MKTITMTPIQTLIAVCLENDASGHTRTGKTILDMARAEHAALVAVAVAAEKHMAALMEEYRMVTVDNNAPRETKNVTAISNLAVEESLANLAAVRGEII